MFLIKRSFFGTIFIVDFMTWEMLPPNYEDQFS